jgi:hypothetical protein
MQFGAAAPVAAVDAGVKREVLVIQRYTEVFEGLELNTMPPE